MSDVDEPRAQDAAVEAPEGPRGREADRPAAKSGWPTVKFDQLAAKATGLSGAQRLAAGALLVLCLALIVDIWRHYQVHAEVMATAEERANFVPNVRSAPVRASDSTMSVTWPGTTEAFKQANIYARASGYISKREVDIGSRVKAGDLLVETTAPEVEHQIAQAEGTLAQMRATLLQAKANRDLAQVTWDRDNPLVQKGWVTPQQGDTDRLTLEARTAAVAVAEANITAQEAQLRVLNQQKVYQGVVAPFDGRSRNATSTLGAWCRRTQPAARSCSP